MEIASAIARLRVQYITDGVHLSLVWLVAAADHAVAGYIAIPCYSLSDWASRTRRAWLPTRNAEPRSDLSSSQDISLLLQAGVYLHG